MIFVSLRSPEYAQSTDLKIYRVSLLNFLMFGTLNQVTVICKQFLQEIKINSDMIYLFFYSTFLDPCVALSVISLLI